MSDGTSLIEVAQLFAEINDPRFVAVGINCTSYENVDQISTYLTDFPLFIYPNLGFVYDTTVHKFVSKALQNQLGQKALQSGWLSQMLRLLVVVVAPLQRKSSKLHN